MAAPPGCIIHFKAAKGPLSTFTETSLAKFLHCHDIWRLYDGEHKEIADRNEDLVNRIRSLDNPLLENFQYHRNCYAKFTNVGLIRRAEKRCHNKRAIPSVGETQNDEQTVQGEEPPKKLLRSSSHLTNDPLKQARNEAVLPPVCIICNKEKSFIVQKVK